MAKICHQHCPGSGSGGMVVLAAVLAVLAAVGLVVWFVAAHLLILVAGAVAAGGLTAALVWVLSRHIVAYDATGTLRAPLARQVLETAPALTELLAERQRPAIPARHVICTVIRETECTSPASSSSPSSSTPRFTWAQAIPITGTAKPAD